jgi:hypothetical protein
LVEKYKGTNHNATQDEVEELKALLFSTIQQTKLDYDANCFKTTSTPPQQGIMS